MVESAGFGGDGAIRQRAMVPSRLEACLFWSLIVLLAAMPLPFGSARPWAWSMAAVVVALLLTHALWTVGSGGARLRIPAHKAWVPLLIAAPAIIWAVVQSLPLGGHLADPLWAAVTAAFQHDGPALVEAVVNRTELSMPPTIKLDQAVGFNLWALKAVLNGRGDELIDLALTNLIR